MKQKPGKQEVGGKKDAKGKKNKAAKAALLRKQIKKPKIENNFEKLLRERIELKMKSKQEVKQIKEEFKTKNVVNKFRDLRRVKPKEVGGKSFSLLGSMKREKKQIFDLDSEDEPLKLTHKGQNLDEMDDFKEKMNESSDEGDMDKETVSKLHFGGFENPGSHKPVQVHEKERKSKKEVYEEIIKKSKLMKLERQKLKEENQMKLEELDNGFSEIAGFFQKNRFQKDEKGKRKNFKRAGIDEVDEDEDDYFALAKQLANDTKAYATDNIAEKVTKTKKEREKRKKQMMQSIEKIWSSEGEEINDDELEEKFSSKRQGLGYSHDKELKKVQKLDSFVDKLRAVKEKKKVHSDEDELENSEGEDDDDDDLDDIDEGDDEEDSDEDGGSDEDDEDLEDLMDDDSLLN